MDLGLAGKRAVVAAASSGLGYSIAEQLGAAGARVAICSRDAERAELAAERIRTATGAEVMSAAVDVADADQVGAWLDAVAATWDGLDLVVPNAGGPRAEPSPTPMRPSGMRPTA
jgi:3-oxoacyl-[acyl-carrier protein] reductase